MASNAAGLPGLTVMNGFGVDDLPTAMQFVGRVFFRMDAACYNSAKSINPKPTGTNATRTLCKVCRVRAAHRLGAMPTAWREHAIVVGAVSLTWA